MNIYVSAIYNISIANDTKNNHGEIGIYGAGYFKDKVTPELSGMAGLMEISRFIDYPIWYFEIKEKVNDAKTYLHNISAYSNFKLGIGFWLIKDCACMSPISYLFDTHILSLTKDIRDVYFCNSQGEVTCESFDGNEMTGAISCLNILTELMISGQTEQNSSLSNDYITSRYATENYNNFNIIQRAVNFLTLARSTTMIPQKIAYYIVTLETLFGNEESSDITHKITYRVPHFFDIGIDKKNEIHSILKAGYSVRSRFIHGAKLDKKHNSQFLKDLSKKIDTILRDIFQLIICNIVKRTIILDKTIFADYFHKKLIG